MKDNIFDVQEYAKVARQAAAEGAVLLKNDNNVLPLAPKSKVALFGRAQFNYYKSGTGSGGMVNTRYVVGISEALEGEGGYLIDQTVKKHYEEWLKDHPYVAGNGWAKEPWFQEEMPLTEELVERARQDNDTAIIIIGRTAGEDKDNVAEAGSYYLTEIEEDMLKKVCGVFERTIVLLNVGNIIDMSWVKKYNPASVIYLWQGGQEGGNGALDVLTGKVNPCGKLTDTIAKEISDYPSSANYGNPTRNLYVEDIYVGYRYFETFAKDRVLYPFGYGLSYTTFSIQSRAIYHDDLKVAVDVAVTNTGNMAGKEVVQVYCEAPQGKLGKPKRVLAGFAKSKLLSPGESQDLRIEIPLGTLSSYDDSGVTGYKSAWVLEEGSYGFYVGGNVREASLAGSITIESLKLIEQLQEALAPVTEFERMRPGKDGQLSFEKVPLRTIDPKKTREKNLPPAKEYTGDLGYKLADVESGKVSMDTFLSQLSDEDLCCIIRGEGMSSPKVTPGTAGAFGGVTESLKSFGLPVACCADGPSGIRMDCGSLAFALPIGTCLACTWNMELVEELFRYEGLELRRNKIDNLLGPGMNIHRHPLNGRNFEYFSEDPLLTGKMAVAQLQGMHKYGVTGTIKHFACNNQESNRYDVEAVVSERALREIYLKGFEIAVKEGGAYSIMTSYNPVNGLWTSSNYDLVTTILRKQWGYKGIVMTDWFAKGNDEGEEASPQNVAAMVRAQNDLYMVVLDAKKNSGNDNLAEALEKGTTSRGEFLRSAANICNYLLTTLAWRRQQGIFSQLDEQLTKSLEEDDGIIQNMIPLDVDKCATLSGDLINTQKGESTHLQVTIQEAGYYRLEITCKAMEDISELAQIPLSIFLNQNFVKTITLTGSDKIWRTEIIDFEEPVLQNTYFIKLYFGLGGMEIKDLKIVKIK
ncbi:glycoside hydrolase family 3 protein [Herbinix luporum]|uniref:glycoside hydrolase family 3 protein n=1 Tax=Herbinix luporum TaxID=1679721 RepID=UPI00175ECD0C|nr:glycoside hydrolase family 3 protein [Herbinix luporum]HHT56194.1 beta-glucosidase [Herbinix luporum]